MAADTSQITECNCGLTQHYLEDLHDVQRMVGELHAEFMRLKPLIDRMTSNPAARWTARHTT